MKKLETFQIWVLCQIPIFISLLYLNLHKVHSQSMKALTLEEVKICIEYCKLTESEQKKEPPKIIDLCKTQCNNGCVKEPQSCFDD